MGMLVPAGQAVVWRGPMVMAAVRQFLKDVQWDALDYLVVDMPPGTGDAQLTLVQQVPVDGVVMVTTPQELALADVRRGIQMFGQVGTSVLGVVENMSYFHCPDNGKDYYIFGQGGGAAVAKEFGVPLLAEIPLDPATREGGDTGRPVVERGDSPTRTAFLELAGRVDASVNP
jgi:ATP-binding protein involved in chromosome partitioning